MPRLEWGSAGTREYEYGADRGVLYVEGHDGVPWNGLVGVDESWTGSESKTYWRDGVAYLVTQTPDAFGGKIKALSSPVEFDECDGMVQVAKGLFATQQPRKSFDFTYRTMIGNDTQGETAGRRIHLVYNALARSSNKSHNTVNGQIENSLFEWEFNTKPIALLNNQPSAHFIIDSTETYPEMIEALEAILYGDDTQFARMPRPDEVIAIIGSYDDYTLDVTEDGVFTVTGRSDLISVDEFGRWTITSDEAVYINDETYILHDNDQEATP